LRALGEIVQRAKEERRKVHDTLASASATTSATTATAERFTG
jgi:hypothetical protein